MDTSQYAGCLPTFASNNSGARVRSTAVAVRSGGGVFGDWYPSGGGRLALIAVFEIAG
jgi:hypothetical protein